MNQGHLKNNKITSTSVHLNDKFTHLHKYTYLYVKLNDQNINSGQAGIASITDMILVFDFKVSSLSVSLLPSGKQVNYEMCVAASGFLWCGFNFSV